MRKAAAAGILAGLAILCVAVERAPAQTTGRTLVLRGGTVVVGDGRVMPGATVVMRDGLIAAVGREAKAPADARVVDVTGARIYPGLIDALTDQGLGADPERPRAASPAAHRPERKRGPGRRRIFRAREGGRARGAGRGEARGLARGRRARAARGAEPRDHHRPDRTGHDGRG